MILATGIYLNLQLLNSSISIITVNITKGIDIIIRGLLHLTRRTIKIWIIILILIFYLG